jgi:hypothetical protein
MIAKGSFYKSMTLLIFHGTSWQQLYHSLIALYENLLLQRISGSKANVTFFCI